MTQLKSFIDFDLVRGIKADTLRLLEGQQNIYSVMEGLHTLTNFPSEPPVNALFLKLLSTFFEQDYLRPDRFNLIRHLRLLPSLCTHARECAPSERQLWETRRNEILFLLVAAQTSDGSWGYFPDAFSTARIEASPAAGIWRLLTKAEQTNLAGRCALMRSHYLDAGVSPDKSQDAVVWTALSVSTLLDAGYPSDSGPIADGVRFLFQAQNAKAGGWGFSPSREPNISATCIALATLLSARGEQSNEFRAAVKKGLAFLAQQLERPDCPAVDVDRGAGRDLRPNTEFTFSVAASVVECLSVAIINCESLFRDERDLGVKTLDLLSTRAEDLIVFRGTPSRHIWELRVVLESLKKLYGLYENQVNLPTLDSLHRRLYYIVLLDLYALARTANGGRIQMRISRRYPLSYALVGVLCILDFAARFQYVNTRSAFLFAGILLILAGLFVAAYRDLGFKKELD